MSHSSDQTPPTGTVVTLQPGLRRLICPNPSPMTYWGTNTYLLGSAEIAVIDPGPLHDGHLNAILGAVEPRQTITHIIVTHSHLDHSPLARDLAKATGAPIIAFGTAEAGRSAAMQSLAATGLAGGGEGIDRSFTPDICVADGDRIDGSDWSLKVLHTPGHLGNHICLGWNDACFTADHVMGWASSLVSPPDGDLTDFMASCRKLQTQAWSVFYPGHGDPILDPQARLSWLIDHRLQREAQVLEALETGPATARTLAERIYTETPAALLGAAERNVFAHLVDLNGRGLVAAETDIGIEQLFRRTSGA